MSKRSLNLIPLATRRRLLVRRALRLWAKSAVLASVCVGLLLGAEWLRGAAALQELNALEAKWAPLERMNRETESLQTRVDRLAAREQLTLRLSRDGHGLAVLAALSLATSEGNGNVYLETIRFEGGDKPGLRIEGAGTDDSAVTGFVERLRRTGVFLAVSVESSGPLTPESVNLRRFDLACQI